MHTYRLILLDASSAAERSIEFKAEDPREAFNLLNGHSGTAELWVDDGLAWSLLHDGDPGVWVLKPHTRANQSRTTDDPVGTYPR